MNPMPAQQPTPDAPAVLRMEVGADGRGLPTPATIVVDAAYVEARLAGLAGNTDLSKYIL